ncbi:MAG: hypothetical protein ACOYMA_15675 [Bacteroidia bacterium]
MKFLTYQKFNDLQSANALCVLLQENNIAYLLENESKSFDPTFVTSELNQEYKVKIKEIDFDLADSLNLQISMDLLNNIPDDYYLYNFTNDELIDIIAKRDEWNQVDFLLAKKILNEKGIVVDESYLEKLYQQRIAELSKPIESKEYWIFIGYIIALLGGVLSVIIGWHLLTYKKRLPNGNYVAGYCNKDRDHGFYLMIIGTIFFIFWLIYKVLYGNN